MENGTLCRKKFSVTENSFSALGVAVKFREVLSGDEYTKVVAFAEIRRHIAQRQSEFANFSRSEQLLFFQQVAESCPDHAAGTEHRSAIAFNFGQSGEKVGIQSFDSGVKGQFHLSGDFQVFRQNICCVYQYVIAFFRFRPDRLL